MFPLRSNLSLFAAILLLFTSNSVAASNSTVVPLKSSAYGLWITAELEFGNQSLTVIADTGSADLWVLAEDWKCSILTGGSEPRSKCLFNGSYHQTSTYHAMDSAWMGEVYGQGDIIGSMGYEDVKLGSLSIPQQQMAFINSTSGGVDSSVSGIMGLAFPSLDQAHPSSYHITNVTEKNKYIKFLSDRLSYPTPMKRLMSMGITYFSIALERTPRDQEIGFGGYLAFGTLPPISHGDFVTVPVEILQGLPSYWTQGKKQIGYWTLSIDAVSWAGQNDSQPVQGVVDSGNGLNYFPTATAEKINAAFDPPAKLIPNTPYFSVHCNATPPANFGLQIGGQVFNIDGADMISQQSPGECVSSVGSTPPIPGVTYAILGVPFLRNVVGVFDYSQHEMKWASRQTNSSSTSPTTLSGAAALGMEGQFLWLALAAVLVMFTLN